MLCEVLTLCICIQFIELSESRGLTEKVLFFSKHWPSCAGADPRLSWSHAVITKPSV